jgi:hypothetical protein
MVRASRKTHVVLFAALDKAFVYRGSTRHTSAKKQQGAREYLHDLKAREADQRADSPLIEKFHRRKQPVCPSRLLYLILFEIRGDERKDVFSQRMFGGGPKDTM